VTLIVVVMLNLLFGGSSKIELDYSLISKNHEQVLMRLD